MEQPTQPINLRSGSSALAQIPQNRPQVHQQPQLQQELQAFWASKYEEMRQTNDFNDYILPLAAIEEVMKSVEDVSSISSEAPMVLAKSCEVFIRELIIRAWKHAQEKERMMLHKCDVAAAAIECTNVIDFSVNVPREDLKDNALLNGDGSL